VSHTSTAMILKGRCFSSVSGSEGQATSEPQEAMKEAWKVAQQLWEESSEELQMQFQSGGKDTAAFQKAEQATKHKFEECLEAAKLHLSLARQVYGEEAKMEVAEGLDLVGKVYARLRQFDLALPEFQEAVQVMIAAEGRDTLRVSEVLHTVGNIHAALGQYDEAEAKYQECLEVLDRMNIEDWLMETANRMVASLSHLGQEERAQRIMQKVDERQHKKYGEFATKVFTEANKHLMHGRHEQALTQFQGIVPVLQTMPGQQLMLSDVLVNIGFILSHLEKHEEALEELSRAIALQQQLLDKNDLRIANSLLNLGVVLLKLNRPEEAVEKLLEGDRIQITHFGEEHEERVTALNNIGSVCKTLGRLPDALAACEEALRIQNKLNGHASTALTLVNIAGIYAQMGDKAKQLELLEEAWAIQEHQGEVEAATKAPTLLALGTALYDAKRMGEAREVFEIALGMSKNTANPITDAEMVSARVLQNLATIHWYSGDFAKSAECFGEASEILEGLLGGGHERVKAAQQWRDRAREEMAKK